MVRGCQGKSRIRLWLKARKMVWLVAAKPTPPGQRRVCWAHALMNQGGGGSNRLGVVSGTVTKRAVRLRVLFHKGDPLDLIPVDAFWPPDRTWSLHRCRPTLLPLTTRSMPRRAILDPAQLVRHGMPNLMVAGRNLRLSVEESAPSQHRQRSARGASGASGVRLVSSLAWP